MAIQKRIPIVATLVLLGLCMSLACWAPSTPVRATWTYPSGFDPHGGYVDRWMWIIGRKAGYTPITSLLLGEIDGIGFSLDANYVPELEANPFIEVNFEQTHWYRSFSFNCQKFPTNITGYRRALAFALDKNLVCEEAEGGLTGPLDGVIPITLPQWTYEDQITDHFYNKDIQRANASLEAAGFRDLDGDGWREYDANNNSIWDVGIDIDDGGLLPHPIFPGCHVPLMVATGYQSSLIAANILKEGMTECGLRASVKQYDYNVMWTHYIFTRKFNVAHFSWGIYPTGDPLVLYDLFHSEGPWNLGSILYNNSDYDTQVEAMMVAPTQEEAKQWAWNCSKILLEDMPILPCYNNIATHAYRTDRWTGYVKMPNLGVMDDNPWTSTSVRLHPAVGGPFGCNPTTYRCSLAYDMVRSNVLTTDDASTHNVFGMIYDTLWELDPITFDLSPLIARNWTIEETSASGDIQDGLKFTFHLFDNITWHDGLPLTSADVAYSLGTLWSNSLYSRGRKVENIYRIETPDNVTVIIYSNMSGIFEFNEATSPYILPKHIWEPQMLSGGDITKWVPETPADFTGSGPYNWTERIPGEYIVLERNPDWVFAVEYPERPDCPLVPLPLGMIGFGMAIVVIVVIASVYYFRKRRQ